MDDYLDEYDKLKEHVKKRCIKINGYCQGARMCSEDGKPLHEFAYSIQWEMDTLMAEVHNFILKS